MAGRHEEPGLRTVDHWEVSGQRCIRHHVAPRKMTFDIHQHNECPVPLTKLQPQCQVEAQFCDGTSQTMSYDWQATKQTQPLREVWVGQTIFKIRNPSNVATGLLTQASRRRLRSDVRNRIQVLLLEKKVMSLPGTMNSRRAHARMDILETFAGEANISSRAPSFGLRAMQPVDFSTGFDLANPSDQQQVDSMLTDKRPWFLVQGIDCKDWCLLQDNTNYIRRKIILLARRRKARKVLNKAADWCLRQYHDGRYFLIENPLTSRLWLESSVQTLMKLPGVYDVTCHAGAYGAVNSRGEMIRKGHRWLTNSEWLASQLQAKLTPEQQRQCVPLEGRETTLSQVYCPGLVKAILLGVRQTIQYHQPERFTGKVHRTWANNIVTDPASWSEVFKQLTRTFSASRTKNHVLATTDPLWDTIKQLVGWPRMERVQISSQPTLMRFPANIPYTHRGWALQFNDGAFEIDSEDLSATRHPRARFAKPVNMAVFFFGQADPPEDTAELPPQVPDDPQQLVSQTKQDGISFKKDIRLSQEARQAITRLHRNLGHPHASDLKKMLAMNGVKNQQLYDAVEALECDACLRTRGPTRPGPAAIKPDGFMQFADAVQMDIFYVRDIRAANHMFLGIIDECTHLHMAILLENRTPEEISNKFRSHWARAFGFPLRIRTDPDGAFRSTFESDMDTAGCFVDYVPPEAHHRMGLIERHNATMRTLMERIIDAQGVVGKEDMEMVAVSSSFAKNSCTWSAGRPPYIAAFGRIPRIGLNLLSDENALIAGKTRDEVQQRADILRCEAQQQIAAMSIDASFRRALLRKTSTTEEVDAPIGSIVAYWRWTAKSGKKRGGYKLARLLGRDPDGRSLWLQAGTNTIKVAPHQLRVARGFEQWTPDFDDVQALRTASENLQAGILQDETIPPLHEDPQQPRGFDNDVDEEQYADIFNDTQPDPTPPLTSQPPQHLLQPDFVPIQPPSQPSQPSQQPHTAEDAVQTDGYEQPEINTNVNVSVASPTHINISRTNQTMNFGMSPEQALQPQVRTPVRKLRAPSTPTGLKRKASQSRLQDGRQQGELLDSVVQEDGAAPSFALDGPASSSRITDSAIRARDVIPADVSQPPGLDSPPQPEVIEVPDDDLPVQAAQVPSLQDDVGDSVPVTPPEVRSAPTKRGAEQMEQQEPPALRPRFHSLMTSFTKDSSCEPQAVDQQCIGSWMIWSRLDGNNQVLKTTHLNGPKKGSILHRRVYQLDTGEILHDKHYVEADDGKTFINQKKAMVTQLWYRQPAEQHDFGMLCVDDDGIQQVSPGHDGTAEIVMPYKQDVFMQTYRKHPEYDGDGLSDDSDIELDNLSKTPLSRPGAQLSRLEQKALDKEIPWQHIFNGPADVLEKFKEAARNEESSWKFWQSVIPLSHQQAKEILADPIQKKRVMRSRAAFRDKSKGIPPLKPKCRVVALGHLDPDLHSLTRDSATPSRQAEYLLLGIYVSGRNQLAFDRSSTWSLWSGDVKTAFLQGTPEERSKPLFLLPPADGVTKAAGVFSAPMYLIKGNIYGLANAPRTWTRHVCTTLQKNGWKQHSLDKMMFYLYQKFPGQVRPTLAAVLIAYVDDFLLTHDSRFDRSKLTGLFTWGSQDELTLEHPLDFKGKQIALRYDAGKKQYTLCLNQAKFIESIKPGKVDKKRLKENIDASDMPEFRSVAGCLQWVAGQTRPDIAPVVSLCSKGTKSTYADLQAMYSAVDHLIETKDAGFNMFPTVISESSLIISYTDSSWANAEGYASQHGSLTLIGDPKITDIDGQALLLDWKSSRSSRVCRSTLAAEASACDTGLDRSTFISYMLGELLHDQPSFQLKQLNRVIVVTDCRSLYDVLCSENVGTDEKRVAVTIRSCQQHVSRADVHWVPTGIQWADGLTKICPKLLTVFHRWLQAPFVKLHE